MNLISSYFNYPGIYVNKTKSMYFNAIRIPHAFFGEYVSSTEQLAEAR
jgi:hypothetical protein